MSDQQMMMAQQNPELAQQVLAQNPQIMPGAQAAASSGMNAPNVSQGMMSGMGARAMNNMQNPQMWQALGGIGQMMRQNQPQHAALMQPQIPGMEGQAPQGGQIARKMPGVLMQVRPSRIY